MTQSRSSVGVIHQATAGIRRGALRRQLQAVAAGKRATVSVDLEQPGGGVGEAIEEITHRLPMENMPGQRLVFSFKRAGAADRVGARPAAKSTQPRPRS